jgi:hypothetical protein
MKIWIGKAILVIGFLHSVGSIVSITAWRVQVSPSEGNMTASFR